METGKDISVSLGKTTIIHQNIPGSELPTHSHDSSEIIFPLHGDLTVSIDKTYKLKYGQMIYIPKDCEHSFSSSDKFGERLILLTSVGENELRKPSVFAASRILIDFSVMLVTSENPVPEHCISTLDYLIQESFRDSCETQSLDSIVAMAKDERLKRAVAFISNNFASNPKLDEIARAAGMSSRNLSRRFSEELGISVNNLTRLYRIDAAVSALQTQNSIAQIAFDLGYASTSQFIAAFRAVTGQIPSAMRPK